MFLFYVNQPENDPFSGEKSKCGYPSSDMNKLFSDSEYVG